MQDTKWIKKTLIRYNMTQCKPPNRPEGLFYPLALLRLIYLLYKLSNRLDGFPSSGTFTACCTSYRTGQTGFLWHFYGLLNYNTPNRLDGLFYPLTLDSSTIRNQLGLGDDHKHGFYTTIVLNDVWSACLIGLIYGLYSGFFLGCHSASSLDNQGSVSWSRVTT